MENDAEKLGKVEEMLNGVADEFSFDPKLRTPPLGRTLGEIEATKSFPVLNRCAEITMVLAHRLEGLGISPEVVVRSSAARLGMKKYHFFVGFSLGGERYYIDTSGNLPIRKNARPERATKGTKFRSFPFRAGKNDSLRSIIGNSGRAVILMRSACQPLLPRYWPLKTNKRKNEKKAFQFNNVMKARARK